MNAQTIMSSPVITTRYNRKIADVKGLFTKNNISCAPVLDDDGEITGIITSTDVSAIHNENLLVSNVMTRKVRVCPLNARVKDMGAIMTTEKIHHVVIMDDGKIMGMVSSLDVILALIIEE